MVYPDPLMTHAAFADALVLDLYEQSTYHRRHTEKVSHLCENAGVFSNVLVEQNLWYKWDKERASAYRF